jgi:hypothetical protein
LHIVIYKECVSLLINVKVCSLLSSLFREYELYWWNDGKRKLSDLRGTLVSLVTGWEKSKWGTRNPKRNLFVSLYWESFTASNIAPLTCNRFFRYKITSEKRSRKNKEKRIFVKGWNYTSNCWKFNLFFSFLKFHFIFEIARSLAWMNWFQ